MEMKMAMKSRKKESKKTISKIAFALLTIALIFSTSVAVFAEGAKTLKGYLEQKFGVDKVVFVGDDLIPKNITIKDASDNLIKTLAIDGTEFDGYANDPDFDRYSEISLNQFASLSKVEGLEDLTISNISNLQNIYFPETTIKKLNINNTTLNIFNSVHSFSNTNTGELGKCALTELNMNITMGDLYQSNSDWYSNQFILNLSGSDTSLTKLNIHVKFTDPSQLFIINASDKAFSNLTADNLTISSEGGGTIQMVNYNNWAAAKTKYPQYTQELVHINLQYLRDCIGKNYPSLGEKEYYTSSEIATIKRLVFNKETTYNSVSVVRDLSEFSKLTSLEELIVEGTGKFPDIQKIAFPNTLKSLEIRDCSISSYMDCFLNGDQSSAKLELPSLESIAFTNVTIINHASVYKDTHGHIPLSIIINDTNGRLKSADFRGSGIENIIIINGGAEGTLDLKAESCPYLQEVTFGGAGYRLNNASFAHSTELAHVGIKDSANPQNWTIKGTFDANNKASLDFSGCTNWGAVDSDKNGIITIDYDFSAGKTLDFSGFETGNIGNENGKSKLVFGTNDNLNSGKVVIGCEENSWFQSTYASKEAQGYVVHIEDSDLAFAVFTQTSPNFGTLNVLRDAYESKPQGYDDHWVRHTLLYCKVNIASYSGWESLRFYTLDGDITHPESQTAREISYDSSKVTFKMFKDGIEIDKSQWYESPEHTYFDGKIKLRSVGDYELRVYVTETINGESKERCVASAYFCAVQLITGISVDVTDGAIADSGDGTMANPISVRYGDVSFESLLTPADDVCPYITWQLYGWNGSEYVAISDELAQSVGINVEKTTEYSQRKYFFPKSLGTSGGIDFTRLCMTVSPTTREFGINKKNLSQTIYFNLKDVSNDDNTDDGVDGGSTNKGNSNADDAKTDASNGGASNKSTYYNPLSNGMSKGTTKKSYKSISQKEKAGSSSEDDENASDEIQSGDATSQGAEGAADELSKSGEDSSGDNGNADDALSDTAAAKDELSSDTANHGRFVWIYVIAGIGVVGAAGGFGAWVFFKRFRIK